MSAHGHSSIAAAACPLNLPLPHTHTQSTHNIRRNNASVHALAVSLSLSLSRHLFLYLCNCTSCSPKGGATDDFCISLFTRIDANANFGSGCRCFWLCCSTAAAAAMAILGSSIYRNCTAVGRWFLWALSSPLLL